MKHALVLGALCLLLSTCGSNIISEKNESSKNLIETYNSIPIKYRDSEGFNSCITSNIQYCHEQAIQQKALEEDSILTCDDLTDNTLKQQCRDSIISLKARDSSDLNSCNKIVGNEKVSCRYSIISQEAVQKLDIDVCKKIRASNDESIKIGALSSDAIKNCKNIVLTSIAIEKGDERLCNKISTRDIKKSCIEQVENYKRFSDANTQTEKEIEK